MVAQLLAAGVETIEADPWCTAESPDLFSHRRDGVTGRFAGGGRDMTSGTTRGGGPRSPANLDRVEARIAAACRAAGRDRAEITLVAVTKTFPADDVGHLAALGVREVGENRAADAAAKVAACREAGLTDLTWHFVGQVQTNKAALVAGCCDVVHSVDRARLVTRAGQGRRRGRPPAAGAGPGRPGGHRRPRRGGADRRTRRRGRAWPTPSTSTWPG